MDYIKNEVNETGAKQTIGSTSTQEVITNVKNAKQNDFAESLESSIKDIIYDIHKKYEINIETNTYELTEVQTVLVKRCTDDCTPIAVTTGNTAQVDFREYYTLIKLLHKTIQGYIDNCKEIDKGIIDLVNNELTIVQNTLTSMKLNDDNKDQYNTLLSSLKILRDNFKWLNDKLKNDSDNDNIKSSDVNSPVFLHQVTGKYGLVRSGGKGLNPLDVKSDIEIYEYNENHETIFNKELTETANERYSNISDEDYFKMSLIEKLIDIGAKFDSINNNHNIENAILKLTKAQTQTQECTKEIANSLKTLTEYVVEITRVHE